MRSRHFLGHGKYAAGLLCLGMIVSCKSDAQQSETAEYGHKEKHIGSYDRLSSAELVDLQADRQYLQRLAKPDEPVRLNMADDRQYRFVLTRMKLAGKTPKNSPHLFELIEKRRQRHLRTNPKQGLAANARYMPAREAVAREMHFIEAAAMSEKINEAVASSTIPGGAFYTYVDVAIYETNGAALSDLGFIEEYDGGFSTTIPIAGDLTQAGISSYTSESYKIEDSPDGFSDSYVFTRTGVDETTARAGGRVPDPELVVASLSDPVDRLFDNGIIKICLERGSPADCDYSLLGVRQLKIPLKGTIQLTSEHQFDSAEITNIRSQLNSGLTGAQYGQLKVILTNVGSGCDVAPDNSIEASMKTFWNNTSLTSNGKSFSWDLTGANSALFDPSCRQLQDLVKLTMRLPLPVVDELTKSIKFRTSVTLSNDPTAWEPLFVFRTIQVVNSCLAEGTMIQLADGKRVPIESIKIGQRIFNSYHASNQFLTVTDMSTGTESKPMVRVEDASGNTLLMTEKHPIQTPDRGMVMAQALQKGDMVMSNSGPIQLVKVTREEYAGKVYNLTVGSESEMAQLGVDQTAVYANGFLVGDSQVQSKYEKIELTQKDGDILDRLPEQWHRDYMNWAARAK